MKQPTDKGLQEDPALQLEPAGREDLIRAAPTEPEAFPRWAEQRRPEEGKFELSRGRVTCNMIDASSFHSRVRRNLVVELGRLLDPDRFDIGAWPPQPTEKVGCDGSIAPAGLDIELTMAATFRGIPDRPTAG